MGVVRKSLVVVELVRGAVRLLNDFGRAFRKGIAPA
jgi:hypothetical protein